eukprot:3537931-Rhodomonas_salina.1
MAYAATRVCSTETAYAASRQVAGTYGASLRQCCYVCATHVCGTAIAYTALGCYAMCGTEIGYAAISYLPTRVLGTDLAYRATSPATKVGSQYAVPRHRHVVRATPCPVLGYRMVLSAYALAMPCARGIGLRPCYAMSGTDTRCRRTAHELCDVRSHLPTSLRACYAMSGTDLAYAATRLRCAVSGTAIA